MPNYNPQEIEPKWQQYWKDHRSFAADKTDTGRPKYYVLDMFPYPSGAGLHVGHPLGYIATDILARYHRLKGFNVLHPMGFDAFGLPAEQYAISRGKHPAETTAENVATFKRQIERMGLAYDPDAEYRTSDPDYYKWTQWGFLQMFNSWYDTGIDKARDIDELVRIFEHEGNGGVNAATDYEGIFSADDWKSYSEIEKSRILGHYRLAYRDEQLVNWCPALGTVLANDEVVNGLSERGGHPVERKPMRQWMLRITAYAERLLIGLDAIDWPTSVVEMQRNWIGKSTGARVQFSVKVNGSADATIEVFTTRPDTLFGVTFMVLAPEHELVAKITTDAQRVEIEAYVDKTAKRSERERLSEVKTVTGAFTGAYATHPVSGEAVPIWIADYVLAGYGTGAVMAVPGHDARDHAFAKQFGIEIKAVVSGGKVEEAAYEVKEGEIINSDFLDGLQVKPAILQMLTHLESAGIGHREVQYRLRDAIFSRQRYWGAPIPITYDENGDNPKAVDFEQLPVLLPEVDDFKPTGSGESPLAKAKDWVNTNGRKRETDTMPGWACSSWYFLRYVDAQNDDRFADETRVKHWLPVDFYLGGAEHAVGHLLYSRFWTKVLHDLGHIPFDEPFKKLVNQGMIQGRSSLAYRHKETGKYHSFSLLNPEDLTAYTPIHIDVKFVKDDTLDINAFVEAYPDFNRKDFELDSDGNFICDHQVEKMSKRYMNVVNPDDICAGYGADTLRLYEMFLGPLEQHKPWNTDGISGIFNYLKKTWRLFHDEDGQLDISEDPPSKEALKHLHLSIRKVQEDIDNLSFNTSIAQFMILTNELQRLKCNQRAILEPYLILLSPYAPHFAEELWAQLGHTESILNAQFPAFDPTFVVEPTVTYPVQINGKVRENIELEKALGKDEVEAAALALTGIQSRLEGLTVRKVIVVPGKIVNIVAN